MIIDRTTFVASSARLGIARRGDYAVDYSTVDWEMFVPSDHPHGRRRL